MAVSPVLESDIEHKKGSQGVSDEELCKVIADFLEMGHVENIVAMFKQDPSYYPWVGTLLEDERFAVRLGVSVLFEYLVEDCPDQVHLAIPSLGEALKHKTSWVRGEAISVLAIIASEEAMILIKTMTGDQAPDVAALVNDILF